MISYEKLAEKPRVFKSITGLDIEEFERLFGKLVPVWVAEERNRLDRPGRKRAIGGGRKYTLKLRDRLVMVMCWLRLYLNTEAMGFFFGVDKATVSRNCRRLLRVLRMLGEETLGWPEPPKRGEGKSIEEALREYPDLLAIVDTTEQRVQRPGDDDDQRRHYSGKKKAHTRKTAIVVNERGRIRDVSDSTPGSKHDLKHVIESRVIDKIPEDVTTIGDAGFDGLQNYYPERSIGTPHKARRNHPLTPDQKLANHEFSSERIVVENTLSHMKHFKVLAHRFRVRHEVVQVAVGTTTSSMITAMLQDSTRCSATGILPRRAPSGKPFPQERWRGAKPSRQKYPSPFWVAAEPREEAATASTKWIPRIRAVGGQDRVVWPTYVNRR